MVYFRQDAIEIVDEAFNLTLNLLLNKTAATVYEIEAVANDILEDLIDSAVCENGTCKRI